MEDIRKYALQIIIRLVIAIIGIAITYTMIINMTQKTMNSIQQITNKQISRIRQQQIKKTIHSYPPAQIYTHTPIINTDTKTQQGKCNYWTTRYIEEGTDADKINAKTYCK